MIDTDSSLESGLAYRPALRISGLGTAEHQFQEALRGIAIDDNDRIHAAGDSAVKIFDGEGRLLRQWTTGRPGFSVAVGGDGRVWVGEYEQVEIFDAAGKLLDTWRDPERLGLVTAVGLAAGGDVFLADAHARWIRRYDERGEFLNNIGDQHRKGGFHIPNGVVDFAIDGDGVLHVANPGMHRVERYEADGKYLGYFGKFDGRDPAGFSGCCNPTNLALDSTGRVMVSEKAGPRAKVYSREGQLLTVVADDEFDREAKNMDIAVDSRGRVYVVDTVRLEIFVFAPGAGEATG
jgi:sugar lactone lactonase YvrE